MSYWLQGNRYIFDSIFDKAILVARRLQPGSRHHLKREIKMRILLITLLCACLGACAFQPLTRDNPFAALDEKIATDTVNQLARLYPPAKTQFNLVVSRIMPPDTFGAVFSPKPADGSNMPAQSLAAEPGIELRYVLNHSGKDFSRITMVIGRAVLARAYLIENDAIVPAGAWTFKE